MTFTETPQELERRSLMIEAPKTIRQKIFIPSELSRSTGKWHNPETPKPEQQMLLTCCLLTTKWYVEGIRIKFRDRVQTLAGLQSWGILNKRETIALSSLIVGSIKLFPYILSWTELHRVGMHCEAVLTQTNTCHWIECLLYREFGFALFSFFLCSTWALRQLKNRRVIENCTLQSLSSKLQNWLHCEKNLDVVVQL